MKSSLDPQRCAKCPIPIVWARSATTGRPMPVDAAPATNGNVRLRSDEQTWIAEVLGAGYAAVARAQGESLHLNHFVTCPSSRDFRKPKP